MELWSWVMTVSILRLRAQRQPGESLVLVCTALAEVLAEMPASGPAGIIP